MLKLGMTEDTFVTIAKVIKDYNTIQEVYTHFVVNPTIQYDINITAIQAVWAIYHQIGMDDKTDVEMYRCFQNSTTHNRGLVLTPRTMKTIRDALFFNHGCLFSKEPDTKAVKDWSPENVLWVLDHTNIETIHEYSPNDLLEAIYKVVNNYIPRSIMTVKQLLEEVTTVLNHIVDPSFDASPYETLSDTLSTINPDKRIVVPEYISCKMDHIVRTGTKRKTLKNSMQRHMDHFNVVAVNSPNSYIFCSAEQLIETQLAHIGMLYLPTFIFIKFVDYCLDLLSMHPSLRTSTKYATLPDILTQIKQDCDVNDKNKRYILVNIKLDTLMHSLILDTVHRSPQ